MYLLYFLDDKLGIELEHFFLNNIITLKSLFSKL